jgi:Transposase and inactivated derivatives
LETQSENLTQVARYERREERQVYRSGHYNRNDTTTSSDIALNVPGLKGISIETAIIDRYHRQESNGEKTLIEINLAGVSVRLVEDIIEALSGIKMSPSTISELNKKADTRIKIGATAPCGVSTTYPIDI